MTTSGTITRMTRTLTLIALFVLGISLKAEVVNLTTEYSVTPLGIDVPRPRFGWQLTAGPAERGVVQTAWQLIVSGPDKRVIWDSGISRSAISSGITYGGPALSNTTRYSWNVTVWDNKGRISSGSSWFETGLACNADEKGAWSGAEWIGGDDTDLVLYSSYLSVFNAGYKISIEPGSTKASFIFGANDPRLMDRYKNIYQLENKHNGSYLKIELDISGVDGTENGLAVFNISRPGYTATDSPEKPFKTFLIKNQFINNTNKNLEHSVKFTAIFGQISITLDGSSDFMHVSPEQVTGNTPDNTPSFMQRPVGATVNLNPAGNGGDYITYGMLCDIGFSADPGQKASFSEIVIRNNRMPGNILFYEDLSAQAYNGIFSRYTSDPFSGIILKEGKLTVDGGSEGMIITADPGRNSAPMLRTEFSTGGKTVTEARLYVTARGIYELFINGRRVGDDYYNPGLTQYNITHLYQTYDITELVRNGDNAIGAMLSEGWWSGQLSFGSIWNHFGDRQSLLVKLDIRYDDGSITTVVTNPVDWKYYNRGPLRYSSLNMGEVYDAREEVSVEGWSTAGYNDSNWKKAAIVTLKGTSWPGSSTERDGTVSTFNYDNVSLTGQIGNNAGIFKVIQAKSVKEVRKGVFVYDLGQNIVGVPRIVIPDGTSGRKMVIRFSEMLYPALGESGNNVGMIMTENYRAALSQDIYIMKDGPQVFQPRFTSHGFQYIEITGIDKPFPPDAVQGVAISSIRELSSVYSTSNPKVNQLWSNIVWSNIDNFLTIPTDCPQRNERMGWSGDLNVFSRTATYISDAGQFMRRHMQAMRDVQLKNGKFTDIAPVGGGFGGILWGSAGIVVAWESYLQYGDIGLLKEHYQAMTRYIDYLETTINPGTGLSSDAALGDWLGPQNNQLGSQFLVTAYHTYILKIMSEIAGIIGKPDDSAKYSSMSDKRKEFFNKTFVSADKKALGLTGGNRMTGGAPRTPQEFRIADVQSAYAVGLALDVFDEENKPYMIKNLASVVSDRNLDDGGVIRPEYSLMTGFIGTAWISKALSDNGLGDLAYRLLQNDSYPSWLYPIDQGATSIWERLNGYTVENGFGGNNGMNSFNHYSFGAVGQWMMAYSLGIQRKEPGFKSFILQPEPDPTGSMIWAKGYYDSMYGRISSSWRLENGLLMYEAEVPANTTATLYLPASGERSVRESGKSLKKTKGLKYLRYEKGKAVFELGSGSYKFTAEQQVQ